MPFSFHPEGCLPGLDGKSFRRFASHPSFSLYDSEDLVSCRLVVSDDAVGARIRALHISWADRWTIRDRTKPILPKVSMLFPTSGSSRNNFIPYSYLAVFKCVMAIASASAASSGLGMLSNRSSARTISCTWRLSAPPYPATACLTSLGVYS